MRQVLPTEVAKQQSQQQSLLDLLTRHGGQLRRHVLQYHRLQGEAASTLSPLDERALTQPIHGFQHLCVRKRIHQQGVQVSEAPRLAQDRQHSTVCSTGERRAHSSSSSSVMLPKTIAPPARNGTTRTNVWQREKKSKRK